MDKKWKQSTDSGLALSGMMLLMILGKECWREARERRHIWALSATVGYVDLHNIFGNEAEKHI